MNTTAQTLTEQHAEVRGEIARTDNKTALLLAFVGALLAGVVTVGKDVHAPPAAYGLAAAGTVWLLTAVAVLLAAVRPRLGGRHGFPLWATLTAEEIRADAATVDIAADIAGLSRLAVTKFTALQRAVDCTRIGGTLLVLAAPATLIGGAA